MIETLKAIFKEYKQATLFVFSFALSIVVYYQHNEGLKAQNDKYNDVIKAKDEQIAHLIEEKNEYKSLVLEYKREQRINELLNK